MTRIKPYDYEKYSTLDIEKYLHEKGYKTKFVNKFGITVLHINKTEVYIDVPIIDVGGRVLADIRFENYPKTDSHDSDQKLYNNLKRKFAKKAGEELKQIKDADKLPIKDYSKKGIWPFNKIF